MMTWSHQTNGQHDPQLFRLTFSYQVGGEGAYSKSKWFYLWNQLSDWSQTKLYFYVCPLFRGLYKDIDQIGPWRDPGGPFNCTAPPKSFSQGSLQNPFGSPWSCYQLFQGPRKCVMWMIYTYPVRTIDGQRPGFDPIGVGSCVPRVPWECFLWL